MLVGETPWRFESSQPHLPAQGTDMHTRATVAEALRLRAEEGLGARLAARRLGLPVATVRDWHADKLPWHSRPTQEGGSAPEICPACGKLRHRFGELGSRYVHLLGLYLGDGCISTHRRNVHRLRIFLDRKYPSL